MNKQNAHLYLPYVQALAEGKTIQINYGSMGWHDSEPDFTLPPNLYRVKPEPREIWVNYYGEEETAYPTKERADQNASPNRIECVRFVEVLPTNQP